MKNTYKILAGLLGMMLTFAQPASIFAHSNAVDVVKSDASAEAAVDEMIDIYPGMEPDYNDPDYVKHQILVSRELQEKEKGKEELQFSLFSKSSAKTTKSPYTGGTYTHAGAFSDAQIVNGIDVSQWQGAIDWEKVKKAGIKYAFIRCGYTALGSTFRTYPDRYYERNIREAYKNGIQVGIYFFTNSKTEAEAKAEAQKTIELLSKYKKYVTLPVVYDFEAFNGSYRAYGTSQAQITKNALAFLKAVEKAGYKGMYYGSTNWIPQYFQVSQMRAYPCWLAQYASRATYTGSYNIWQYSSTGQINGISGYVDCDFWYKNGDEDVVDAPEDDGIEINIDRSDLPAAVTGFELIDSGASWIDLAWDASYDADGYKIYRSDAYDGDYKLIEKIVDFETVDWRDTTVETSHGRQYYYKIVPYLLEDGIAYDGAESRIVTAYTLPSYKYKFKTLAELNLRSQAGSDYALLATVPKGTKFTTSYYTYSVGSSKWYKVDYTYKGKTYTGYLAGNLVKRTATVKPE